MARASSEIGKVEERKRKEKELGEGRREGGRTRMWENEEGDMEEEAKTKRRWMGCRERV